MHPLSEASPDCANNRSSSPSQPVNHRLTRRTCKFRGKLENLIDTMAGLRESYSLYKLRAECDLISIPEDKNEDNSAHLYIATVAWRRATYILLESGNENLKLKARPLPTTCFN